MEEVNISKLELAINLCSKQTIEPRTLSPQGSRLAEIYGLMIYEKKQTLDFDDYLKRGIFTADHAQALEEFYGTES